MIINKDKLKDYIADYEANHYGGNGWVKVVNMKVKVRERMVVADIVITDDYEQTSQRYNQCEYPLDFIMQEGI